MPNPSTIDQTLAERGTRYGVFTEHARITQAIKAAMIDSPNWQKLAPDQRECLEMIAHKVGRILNGDPDYHDSWHDINGYTKLVADRLLPPVDTTSVTLTRRELQTDYLVSSFVMCSSAVAELHLIKADGRPFCEAELGELGELPMGSRKVRLLVAKE